MEITVFSFRGQNVRTVIKDGEPWFVAKDVCDVLGITNSRDAVAALDEDERMTVGNSDSHSGQRGGAQFLNVVNESGLYALIFKSRKPEAKAFRKWVTSEVLPAIRKTGGYIVAKEEETPEEILARALIVAKETTQKGMNAFLFEIKERAITNPDGSVRIVKTPKITGRGQVYFVNKFMQVQQQVA